MSADADSEQSLAQLFHSVWLDCRTLNNTFGPELQTKLTNLLPQLQHLLASINELDLFSLNEDLADLTVATLPFLMTHALAGFAVSKQFTNREERLQHVETASEHFKQFELLTQQFGFAQVYIPSRDAALKSQANTVQRRDALIQSKKEQARLEQQITAFVDRLRKDPESIDEGFKREMYEKCVKQLVYAVHAERENLNMELGFLKNGPVPRPPAHKPMILTKDAMQAKVFGAGYPSIPTMSVEEFADKELAKVMPSQEFALFKQQQDAHARRNLKNAPEEQEKIPSDEDDSDAALYKKRQFDAFKDDNRRGS